MALRAAAIRAGAARPMNWRWRTPSTPPRRGRMLDIKMQAERHNVVKVLLLLDIGGSMDDHVKTSRQLFSRGAQRVQASRALFFPQFTYEALVAGQSRRSMTPGNCRSHAHLRQPITKLILVGDATNEPYEITPTRRQRRALEMPNRGACGWQRLIKTTQNTPGSTSAAVALAAYVIDRMTRKSGGEDVSVTLRVDERSRAKLTGAERGKEQRLPP